MKRASWIVDNLRYRLDLRQRRRPSTDDEGRSLLKLTGGLP